MDKQQKTLTLTGDGSTTLFNSEIGEHYHSTHGALQESLHVFIMHGLMKIRRNEINIFEMGLGTGLNFLLSAAFATQHSLMITYTGLEKYPIEEDIAETLNFSAHPGTDKGRVEKFHQLTWNEWHNFSANARLVKAIGDIQDFNFPAEIDLAYWDAFSPAVQPELWTEQIFRRLYLSMRSGGLFTTYCSRIVVQKALRASGFKVEKHPGPPGKREILNAIKV